MQVIKDATTKRQYAYDPKTHTVKAIKLLDVDTVPVTLLPAIAKCERDCVQCINDIVDEWVKNAV